eukprot:358273-Chlamydomonas_euryale.AAC.8
MDMVEGCANARLHPVAAAVAVSRSPFASIKRPDLQYCPRQASGLAASKPRARQAVCPSGFGCIACQAHCLLSALGCFAGVWLHCMPGGLAASHARVWSQVPARAAHKTCEYVLLVLRA